MTFKPYNGNTALTTNWVSSHFSWVHTVSFSIVWSYTYNRSLSISSTITLSPTLVSPYTSRLGPWFSSSSLLTYILGVLTISFFMIPKRIIKNFIKCKAFHLSWRSLGAPSWSASLYGGKTGSPRGAHGWTVREGETLVVREDTMGAESGGSAMGSVW